MIVPNKGGQLLQLAGRKHNDFIILSQRTTLIVCTSITTEINEIFVVDQSCQQLAKSLAVCLM